MNQNITLYEAQGSTLKQNRCFPNTRKPFTLRAPRLRSDYKTLHMSRTVYLKHTHKHAQPSTHFHIWQNISASLLD